MDGTANFGSPDKLNYRNCVSVSTLFVFMSPSEIMVMFVTAPAFIERWLSR